MAYSRLLAELNIGSTTGWPAIASSLCQNWVKQPTMATLCERGATLLNEKDIQNPSVEG